MKLKFYKKFLDKKKYRIYLASKRDSKSILNFIDKFWKKNHIFVKSKKLFKFQHQSGKKLNWVLAKNVSSGKLEGVLGLVSKNFFANGKICKKDDIWIAIIMVAYPLKPSKGLGTEMIKYFHRKFKPSSISAIGINKNVANLYKKLGLKIGYVIQYYLKNKKNSFYKNKSSNLKITKNIKKIKSNKNFDQKFKHYQYFSNRYFKHPIYDYFLCILYEKKLIKNFFILRKIKYGKKVALRIVDLGNIKFLNKFKKENFEYLVNYFRANHIDFLNYGIKKEFFKKIGLSLRKKNVFIPHNFEPFKKKNKDVMIAYISNNKNFYVFKGDSDLDRPALL